MYLIYTDLLFKVINVNVLTPDAEEKLQSLQMIIFL